MPHREQLAFLRQCEAEAVEQADAASDETERDRHFDAAATYAAQIMAIERQSSAG